MILATLATQDMETANEAVIVCATMIPVLRDLDTRMRRAKMVTLTLTTITELKPDTLMAIVLPSPPVAPISILLCHTAMEPDSRPFLKSDARGDILNLDNVTTLEENWTR